jgi:DNA-binding FadR family transcriptional regulator
MLADMPVEAQDTVVRLTERIHDAIAQERPEQTQQAMRELEDILFYLSKV